MSDNSPTPQKDASASASASASSGTGSERSRGRPANDDSADMRCVILAHASEAFAASGLDATSMQQVADAAGVNRRLVYHYFESKDRLYLEVLDDIYGQLTDIANQLSEHADTLDVFIDSLARSFFGFCVEHPAFVRMLMWENLRGAQGLKTLRQAAGVIQTSRQRMKPLVEQAIAGGHCRADLDPDLLMMSVLGQCLYLISNAASLELVFHMQTHSEVIRQRWIEHVVISTQNGVRSLRD